MSDIHAGGQQTDINNSFWVNLFIRYSIPIIPIVFYLFLGAFSDFKVAFETFIRDHPQMPLGGLPVIVWLVLLVFYLAYITIDERKMARSRLFYRVLGRGLVVIIIFILFYKYLSTLDFGSFNSKKEFLGSFVYYYFATAFAVIIPSEAHAIRRLLAICASF